MIVRPRVRLGAWALHHHLARRASDSYEHWRETDHDDLVLATALACRQATRRPSVVRVVDMQGG